MTLRHLRLFAVVCETLSMTKSAEKLNMTQPAVSKAISELEAFYSVPLFDRIGRKLYLTEAGRKLLGFADTILSQYDESVALLRDGTSFQSCRLCVNQTVGESVLASLCGDILKRYPEINLEVGVYNVSEIEGMLRNNACDIAVTDRMDEDFFTSEYLYSDSLSFYASERYTRRKSFSMDDLSGMRLLLREPGSGNRTAAEPFLRQMNIPSSAVWTGSADNVLYELARAGLGAALLPDSYMKNRTDSGLHRLAVTGMDIERRFYLVHVSGRYLNSGVRACMDTVRRFCRKER